MQIQVNGEKMTFDAQLTVRTLLDHLGINPQAVAVEHNLNIVNRDDYAAAQLQEGDSVEVIRFVGGG